MPPKRGATKPKQEAEHKDAAPKQETNTPTGTKPNDKSETKKRKTPAANNEPQKSARRSGRSATKSQPTQQQLLNFLLTKDAEDLCRPEDETADLQTRGAQLKTYTASVMTPFEELLSAVVLSRPISHRLGLRAIRTILNAPYNFSTPGAIQAAGREQTHQALLDARTQHKAKTAEQICQIADVVRDRFTTDGDVDAVNLGKLLYDCDGDVERALDMLREDVKGLGGTGTSIFLRRVQWLWPDRYPFIDPKTALALRKLGLPEEAEELRGMVEEVWSQLETGRVAGDGVEEKKRRAFVVVLERAVGAELEGKVDMVLDAAADRKM